MRGWVCIHYHIFSGVCRQTGVKYKLPANVASCPPLAFLRGQSREMFRLKNARAGLHVVLERGKGLEHGDFLITKRASLTAHLATGQQEPEQPQQFSGI